MDTISDALGSVYDLIYHSIDDIMAGQCKKQALAKLGRAVDDLKQLRIEIENKVGDLPTLEKWE